LRYPVVSLVRKLYAGAAEDSLEVSMGNMKENAGAVARARVTAGCPAMSKTPQDLDAHPHDFMRGRTL
jgi:hypothetical protein